MSEQVARLAHEVDLDGFRRNARLLIAKRIAPPQVQWQIETRAEQDLFAGSSADIDRSVETRETAEAAEAAESAETAEAAEPAAAVEAEQARIAVPPHFLALCRSVVLHSDVNRFGLLYRLLWRLINEPALRNDPLDADRLEAELLARAVRRDIHKMTAFVRFRPLVASDNSAVQHVAWFEPGHHIVEAAAPFFVRRFAQMNWAILTPERCVRWDQHTLSFGPGANASEKPPADAAEQLWLTYYASIFNPARLKLAMMQKEMPRRYWKNLPEAALIHSLSVNADERSGRMVEQAPTTPVRRRPASSAPLQIASRPVVVHAPGSLAELHGAIERCRDCPLGALATRSVSGEGHQQARLMMVGEQPGDREDLAGRPFVGPAGQLLNRALEQLSWPRGELYLSNVVRHFKYELRGKRRIHKTPRQQEIDACLHWLESEITLVKPELVLALGATAASALLGRAVAPMKERGRSFKRADGLRVMVTLHPSALLRMEPAHQAAAFEEWLADLARAKAEVS